MKKISLLVLFLSAVSALAENGSKKTDRLQTSGGETRMYFGVARGDASSATMDLIKVCLGNPLIQAGSLYFEGIENLKFTQIDNSQVFTEGECIFKAVSK